MDKKKDRETAKTPKEEMTSLHEACIQIDKFENGPSCCIDGDGWSRLVTVLEQPHDTPQAFFGFDLFEEPKRECYINLSHVIKINVLDCLAGLPSKKRPKLTVKEFKKNIEEREASDDTIILRVWMVADKTVELYNDISYEDWASIRQALEENDQRFIGFTDEDGERVILSVQHIGAIEAFDTHYLNDEEMNQIFGTKEEEP
jgi:hypothetical protein